jgi:hypothetical protein
MERGRVVRIALFVVIGLALWGLLFLLVAREWDAVTCFLWAAWSPCGPLLLWYATRSYERISEQRAWGASEEGKRLERALASWWVAKARVEAVRTLGEATLTRTYPTSNGAGRRAYRSEARAFVELAVRLLPLGGGEVVAHERLTVPAAELGALKVGAIVTVLYDPRDPQRFCIDSVRRDGTTIDGAALRTKAAEETASAAQRLRLSDATYR